MIIRRFEPRDAEAVSRVVINTLRISNSGDYSAHEIAEISARQTPEDLLKRAGWTHTYVAEDDGAIVGCGAIGPYWDSPDESSLFTIFVRPDRQGGGIGRRIVEALERDEYALRAWRIEIPASITALRFYQKLGYTFKPGHEEPDEERLYRLEKHRPWRITAITPDQRQPALDMAEATFTAWRDNNEGAMVRRLVEEIRSKPRHIPELELTAVDRQGDVIGYAMFSRFGIERRYEDELLILTPVAVRPDMQRRHISRELIEYGFERAKALRYKAVLVEGDPRNYNPRGFVTSADHGIVAAESVHLPRPECLMVKELVEGGLDGMYGVVDYACFEALKGE